MTTTENNNIYYSAFLNSPDGIAILQLSENTIVEINDSFKKIFGITESLSKSLSSLNILSKEQESLLLSTLKQNEEVHEFEISFQKQNEKLFIQVSARPFYSERKKYAIINFHNNTEHKTAENSLFNEKEYSETLLNSLPGIFYQFDVNGKFSRWNDYFLEFTGYKEEEIQNLTALDFFEKKDHAYMLEQIGKVFQKGYATAEANFIIKSGKKFPFLFTGKRLLLNGELYLVGMGVNTSEIKAAEKVVKESEEVLTLATESSNTGIYDFNIITGEVKVNREYTSMLGYDFDNYRENFETWSEKIHPNDKTKTIRNAELYLKGEKSEYKNEFRLRKKDGDYIWILSSGKIVERDSKGNPTRMLGTHINIDKLKKVENELRESNKDLEQFAYIASHDLQEPLRKVKTYAELLELKYGNKLDKKAKEYLEVIESGADRMNQLINDLLLLSRISTKGKEFTKVDLNWVVEYIKDILQIQIEDSNATISYEKLPIVQGDEAQLIQLFQNLISNAIKFRGDEMPLIYINVKKDSKRWIIGIADNGIGMDMQFAKRIFVVFQRLHSKNKYRGTGIGLAICKKIVERHKGKIWVESEPDKGSTFYFSIPKKS